MARVRHALVTSLTVLALVLPSPSPAQARASDLDPSFGQGGTVTVSRGEKTASAATAMALQPDGRIVLADSRVVVRLLPDGKPDATFGNAGTVVIPTSTSPQSVNGIAVNPDGKILVAGYRGKFTIGSFDQADPPVIFLARFDGSGNPDSTFGQGGIVTTASKPNTAAAANAVALQPDGKIVVGGYTRFEEQDNTGNFINRSEFTVVRYSANGVVDQIFGEAGVASADVGERNSGDSLALQPDGSIVLAGKIINANGTDSSLGVVRFTKDGTLDSAFGAGGVVQPEPKIRITVRRVAILPSGAILVGGTEGILTDDAAFVLVRLTPDGRLDPTFGNGGKATALASLSGRVAEFGSFAVLPNGGVIQVGSVSSVDSDSDGGLTLVRWRPNGTVDDRFGNHGLATTQIPAANTSAAAYDVAIDGAGRIVAAGGTGLIPEDMAVARFLGASGAGYYLASADNGVFAFGAPFAGSPGKGAKPAVGIATDPDGKGYYLADADGAVFAHDAPFLGSMAGKTLSAPIVGIAADRDGKGYYLVGADGAMYAFDAPNLGTLAGTKLKAKIVGMATDPDGRGYYLVGADGGIFAYEAPFLGSTGALKLNQPIVGMATDPDGKGYYLVAADGGVFAYEAPFLGSTGAMKLNQPIVGMATDPDGRGYYLVAADGGIFAYDATFLGSTGAIKLNQPIVGMTALD